jgi:hypothetical protein
MQFDAENALPSDDCAAVALQEAEKQRMLDERAAQQEVRSSAFGSWLPATHARLIGDANR